MKSKNYFFIFMIYLTIVCSSSNLYAVTFGKTFNENNFTCDDVSQIIVPIVSVNSATVTWTSGTTGNTWDIAVGLSVTTDPSTLEYINSSTTTKEIIDLLPGTQYKVWVRSVCEVGGNGEWIGPILFTTDCLPIANFNENFDTTVIPNLPVCWNKILRGENLSIGAKIQTVSYNSFSAPNVIEITNWGSTGEYDIILVSPNLSNLTAGTHRLRFTSKGIATLQVGTLSTNTAQGVFSVFQDVTSTLGVTEFVIDFDTYAGSDTHIAIRLNEIVADNFIFLDNFIWEPIPPCTDVANISVTSTTPNTANIEWIPGTGESSWDIAIGTSTDTDPSLLPYENTSETSNFTATDLEISTSYKVWVRSVCEGGINGLWIGPVTFTTDCNAVATFNQNFDNVAVPNLPSCWTKIVRGDGITAGAKVETSSSIIISGENSVNLFRSASTGDFDIILVSSNLSSLGTGNYRLRFFAKFASNVEVGTLNSNTNVATFNLIETVTTINGLAEYIVDFSDYEGTDHYIGFRIPTISPLYETISLDNIIWEPIPECPEVTAVNVPLVTNDTAIIDWTSSESSWEIAYGATTVNDPSTLTPIEASESPFELTELYAATTYKIWVRSVCDNSNGAWVGPVLFTTECMPVGTFIQNFDTTTTPTLPICWSKILRGNGLSQFAYIETSSSNNSLFPNFTAPNHIQMNAQGSEPSADIILVSSKVSTLSLGNHRLKFDSFYPGSLQIGTLDGNTNAATFTPLQTVESGGFTGSSLVINFSSYTGSDTYIGIRLVPDQNILPSVNLDNIVWEPIPSCPDVTAITVPDVSQNGATISWIAGGDEDAWQVAVGEDDVTDPNTLTAETSLETTLIVDELTASTSYKVWVRSVCTDENGGWIGPILFVTPCIASDVPYSEDFQSVSVPELPLCTSSQVTYVGSNSWVTHNGASSWGFPTKALRYYDSMDTANAWFFTRAINLVEGQNYTITYKKGTNSNFSWTGGNLKVLYGTSPSASAMTTTLADHVGFYGAGVTENISFTVPTSGIYYFCFNVYSNAYSSSVFLDDIVIDTDLSLNENNWEELSLYPNPVDDVLNISHTENMSTVMLYNVLGQQVVTKEINAEKAKIDLSGLAKGTYLARITSNNTTKTIKILKN